MSALTWLVMHSEKLLEDTGIVGGLLFTGLSLRVDARVRHAETELKITENHRAIWADFYTRPSLAGVLDPNRDMKVNPPTGEEIRFVNSLLLHLRSAFYAAKAGIYVPPQKLGDDIRAFLKLPVPSAAWAKGKRSHDDKFVAFVENALQER